LTSAQHFHAGYGRIKAIGQHCNKLLPIARHSLRQINGGWCAKSSFDNHKTKALGLNIPESFLVRTDEVIE